MRIKRLSMNIPEEIKYASKQIGYGLVVMAAGLYFAFSWAEGEHLKFADRFQALDERYTYNEANKALRDAKKDWFHIVRELNKAPGDDWVASRHQEVLSNLNEAERALGLQETSQE